jgi:hypothetical protein
MKQASIAAVASGSLLLAYLAAILISRISESGNSQASDDSKQVFRRSPRFAIEMVNPVDRAGNTINSSKATDRKTHPSAWVKDVGGELEKANEPSSIDLTGLVSNADKIEKILASFSETNTFWIRDPRVDQLRSLGDAAVNDLLDALDHIMNRGRNDPAAWTKQSAIEAVLGEMLREEDKEIILTYYQEHGRFSDLALKYFFREAGQIAMARALGSAVGGGGYTEETAKIALALDAENSIPAMLRNAQQEYDWHGNFLETIAKQAPHVDIRPTLQRVISSIDPAKPISPAKAWAGLALVRGMPEGFDAAIYVLRSDSVQKKEMLEIVRNFVSFRGSAEQTAKWLEENRSNIVPEPKLPFATRVPSQPNLGVGSSADSHPRLISPYKSQKGAAPNEYNDWYPSGTAVRDQSSGKLFLVP